MSNRKLFLSLFMLFIWGVGSPLLSQDKKKEEASKEEKKEDKEDKEEKEDKSKSILEIVKKSEKIPGLFTIYRDSASGKAHMLLFKNQLDKEYIHFSYIENGLLEAGFFRGAYLDEKILSFKKYYDKIEIIQENTNYYYNPESPIARAADANINKPILASMKIEASSKEKDSLLVAVDGIFLSEALQQIKRGSAPGRNSRRNPFQMGGMDKGRTKYVAINNYPSNTDVIVDYVYTNGTPTNFGMGTATDARVTTLRVQHSLIEVPDNDYQVRYDDARVGYFMSQVTDQTSYETTPYRDMIHRWHLVKKDPDAALSEPVEPITWWIENTTPTELRPLVKRGVEAWNIAFEQAGFKNAIVVKEQPDTASWEAGDIRYNVIRWTSSPIPPFGGYGPSFVNPRTGQILGADVMIEDIFMKNRVRVDKLYLAGSEFSEIMKSLLEEEEALHEQHAHHENCIASDFLQNEVMMAKVAGKVMNLSEAEKNRLVEEAVVWLILHEVGHTLGLNHNMKSSNLWSPEEINNIALTSEQGLIGSVMDYPAINLSSDPENQGNFSSVVPGPYDRWAIQYGYSEATEEELTDILSRSTEPALMFGNDADDMRSPGRGIDPRVMIGDMSSDGIGYARDRIEMINTLMGQLTEKFATEGNSYQELRNGYNILMGGYNTMLRVTSRFIGGVYVDRAVIGQEGATKPFIPVEKSRQKEAMASLAEHAFSPDAFQTSSEVYNYLQSQRRGFDHFGRNEDPSLHRMHLDGQLQVLVHLVHPSVLRRITDSQLYGNTYSVAEVMSDLTDAIINEDLTGNVNTMRQNLQLTYLDGLFYVVNGWGGHDKIARSAALNELLSIRKKLKKNKKGDLSTQAHRKHMLFIIEAVLDLEKS